MLTPPFSTSPRPLIATVGHGNATACSRDQRPVQPSVPLPFRASAFVVTAQGSIIPCSSISNTSVVRLEEEEDNVGESISRLPRRSARLEEDSERKGVYLHLGPDRVGPQGLAIILIAALIAVALGIRGFLSPGLLAGPSSFAPPRPTSSVPSSPPTTSAPRVKRAGDVGTSQPSVEHQPRGRQPPTARPTAKLGPLLSSTQFASVAYQIYPNPVSSTAQSALAGFQVSFKHGGSQVVMTITASGTSQPPTHQTYAASDRVYFIEASFGDDSGNQEFNLGDDGVIATNAQGRIVTG